tara:strand:- start:633 stop:1109 length:477 start_codon:yes stop_codon:yes gene_type:complete
MKRFLFVTIIFSFALFSCNKDNNNAFDPELVGHWKLSDITTTQGFDCNWDNGQVDIYISESGSFNIEFITSESGTAHEFSVGGGSTIIDNSKLIISFIDDNDNDDSRVFNYSIQNNTLTITQDPGQPEIKWVLDCDGNQDFMNSLSGNYIELNNLEKQ